MMNMEVADLRKVMESVRNEFAGTAALAAAEWKVTLPEAPCLVRVDVPAFSRMVVYLLMDALRFVPSCVTMELRVAADRRVEVCISDNGQDRFSGCMGHGYGSLVRELAEALKGELRMETVVGKGTKVVVAFAPDLSLGTAVAVGAKPEVYGEETAWSPGQQEFLDRVKRILEAHLTDTHFTVDKLAQELGLSRTAMFVKLKGMLGMTPNGFLRFFRLQKAEELLTKSELQVSEVCFQVGFSSPSYFTQCFQQQYGMKPAEYKRLKGT